jgi:glycosyltransferase involved in cell wall biosynthesis
MRHRLEKAGCEVIHRDFVRPRRMIAVLENFRFLRGFWSDVASIKALARLHNVDVIEVAGLLNLQPLIAGLLCRKPVVYQLHSALAPRFIRAFLARVASKFVAVIMTSGRGLISRHGGLSRSQAKIIPFNSPVDILRFCPDSEARTRVRTDLGLATGDIVVGTLGNRGWQKRHEWIVEVARLTRDSGFRYVIAGTRVDSNDEYYKRSVVDRIVELKLEGTVSVVEQVHSAENLMNAFDVFILPSVSEGASLVTGEAMATGLPVIASDVGSISDLVGEENGILCDPSSIRDFVDAIGQLSSPDIRSVLGQASRVRAKLHCSQEACAEAHMLAYRTAFGDVTLNA